ALQALATHRLLSHAIRSIAEGETLVVQVAVLAKFRQHRFNYLSIRPLFFQQALTQFRDRARLGRQQLDGALKRPLTRLLRINPASAIRNPKSEIEWLMVYSS